MPNRELQPMLTGMFPLAAPRGIAVLRSRSIRKTSLPQIAGLSAPPCIACRGGSLLKSKIYESRPLFDQTCCDAVARANHCHGECPNVGGLPARHPADLEGQMLCLPWSPQTGIGPAARHGPLG